MSKLCLSTCLLNLITKKSFPRISRTQAIIDDDMVTHPRSSRRPTCPACSKPVRTCLCTQLGGPRLNNSVKITVLQHSLEQKHPLNSTRIATLGLENVEVFDVSDVNFSAHFLLRLLGMGSGVGFHEEGNVFDEMPERGDIGDSSVLTAELHGKLYDKDEKRSKNSFFNSDIDETAEKDIFSGDFEAVSLDFIIGKYGTITSFSTMPPSEESIKTSFEQLLTTQFASKFMKNGFVVKKIQTNKLISESEEFEINIPPKSVLLFPSENSVSIEDIDFEVKNLIVLDGTWAKAKRMYSENPWLRLLPHVRLDVQKSSLFGEVRHQPKAGYLSTIESIVYALKATGEDDEDERLDSLLDVFETMVRAQRDCKNERLLSMGNS